MGIDRNVKLFTEGLRSPKKIKPYLERRYSNFKYGSSVLNSPHQKKYIHEFIEQEKFAIIILDSCRFDYFDQEVNEFLDGELESVYTSATYTKDYIQTIWEGNYDDLTYITGLSAPTDHAFERGGKEYRPSEHFSNFVHVWKFCENKEFGAVPPEEMTQAALKQFDDKMVVHYVQPHAPYIGEYQLRNDINSSFEESLQDIYKRIGRYGMKEKTISDEELKKAYRSNLRRALASVRQLVTQLNRPVVITADHGEMLGEEGRYIHGGIASKQLCRLPWYLVDESEIGIAENTNVKQVDQSKTQFTNRDVEEQLKSLGYL